MQDSDIVLVTTVPAFEVVDDFLQFTITSGRRDRTFRLALHKGWAAMRACQKALEDGENRPDNVKAFSRKRGPGH